MRAVWFAHERRKDCCKVTVSIRGVLYARQSQSVQYLPAVSLRFGGLLGRLTTPRGLLRCLCTRRLAALVGRAGRLGLGRFRLLDVLDGLSLSWRRLRRAILLALRR